MLGNLQRHGITATTWAVMTLGICASSRAAVPTQITVQGLLTDAAGTPLPPGVKAFTFKIFDASVGGAEIWPLVPGEEDQIIATTAAGLWTAAVGRDHPLTDQVFSDTVRWLEITVNDGVNPVVTLPRIRLNTGPFAFRVATVDGASGGNITSKVSIGPGHTNTGANAFVAGENNTVSGDHAAIGGGEGNYVGPSADHGVVSGGLRDSVSGIRAVIGGGENNNADANWATVGGGYSNSASGNIAAIGGGSQNTASGGATIGGGYQNSASGNDAAIGGGSQNTASNDNATIGGGSYNQARGLYSVVSGGGGPFIQDSNAAVGGWSVVTGGSRNAARGDHAAIGGGHQNTASDTGAVVGGGGNNKARGRYSVVGGGGGSNPVDSNAAEGDWSIVAGGRRNAVSGDYSVIGGGFVNTTSDKWATIAGGVTNTAGNVSATVGGGRSNLATGAGSVVCGGELNRARGSYSFVGGGGSTVSADSNAAVGDWSTVPGGRANVASGDYAFAAGQRAKAIHNGSFVWADQTASDFVSTADNQFLIRAGSGVGIGTNSPEAALHVMDGSAGAVTAHPSSIAVFEGSGNGYLSVLTPDANSRGILFGGPSNRAAGGIDYNNPATPDGLRFFTNGNIVNLIVDSLGQVGIGVNSPERPLHVQDGSAGIVTGNGNSSAVFERSGENWIHILSPDANQRGILFGSPANALMGSIRFNPSGTANGFHFRCGTNNVRLILDSLGNLTADGCVVGSNIACPSDARLKQDVRTLGDALGKLGQLRGVEYRWNDSVAAERGLGADEQIGLVAQEVQKVVPQAVVTMNDGYLAVDYSRLVPLLIEAIKEQQREIDALKADRLGGLTPGQDLKNRVDNSK